MDILLELDRVAISRYAGSGILLSVPLLVVHATLMRVLDIIIMIICDASLMRTFKVILMRVLDVILIS